MAVRRLRVSGRFSSVPPIEAGDRHDQPTFHERYEAMPEEFRAELVEGVVFVPSPLGVPHGREHAVLMGWLVHYQAATPGTTALAGATVILGPDSEPQPDGALLLSPERGGQTRMEGIYLAGPPELVAEVASSSQAYDLHGKYRDYERAGVAEYLVVVVRERRVAWFVRHEARFRVLGPGPDGVLRSEVFPGLWLEPAALLAGEVAGVLATLDRGLASPEHTAWVAGYRPA